MERWRCIEKLGIRNFEELQKIHVSPYLERKVNEGINMSTGIYIENCDDVQMSGNTFIGLDKAIVARNSSRIRSDGNIVIERSPGLSISPDMLQLVKEIYDQHKHSGREAIVEKLEQDSRIVAFAKIHGLGIAGLLASIAGLLK